MSTDWAFELFILEIPVRISSNIIQAESTASWGIFFSQRVPRWPGNTIRSTNQPLRILFNTVCNINIMIVSVCVCVCVYLPSHDTYFDCYWCRTSQNVMVCYSLSIWHIQKQQSELYCRRNGSIILQTDRYDLK